MIFSRFLAETLAPGVNARETAERDTPACFATCNALTYCLSSFDDFLPLDPICLMPNLGKHIGAQESLDDQHEAYRGNEQQQRGDRGNLIIAA